MIVVKEENPDFAQRAEKNIHSRFQKWCDLGKIDRNTLEQLRSYVTVSCNIQDLAGVDLIIEAIPENMEWKKQLFAELDRVMPEQVILASNTSSLPINPDLYSAL